MRTQQRDGNMTDTMILEKSEELINFAANGEYKVNGR